MSEDTGFVAGAAFALFAFIILWAVGVFSFDTAAEACEALNAPTTLTALADAVVEGEYTVEQAGEIRRLCSVEVFGPLPQRGG